MTSVEGVFTEATAVPKVRSVKLSHLSIELGHLYMDDFKAGRERLLDNFRSVRPWASTATEACSTSVRGRPRISTCFLIDDYFTRFSSPAEVIPALLSAAEETGLQIDYIARESACAQADGVDLATLVQQRLVEEPPVGSNGSRPPSEVSGWLCNGERSPSDRPAEAMAAPAQWRPPRQSAFRNHSIFIDVELWRDEGGRRLWSCPFLAAVWQLQRLGLLRHHGEPVGEPRPITVAELPAEWDALPPVVQLNPGAAAFHAYRTFSALGSRFLGIEVAVRTILSQVSVDSAVAAQVASRAAGEGFPLPDEVVERIGYAFL
ncbi:SCO2522 family protein [Couchioplanes caeruleus]|uniref:SCO2522 family protein n=1 Tax=Couchioplanes caeruleus TaxID=56438 RepID=UPI0020C06C00|nr:SCO2522 family protein [Couchioplanes caeruleus]UQU64036.1 SCO2522 family protein [Couchioplanes caeruleus]